MRSVDEIGKRRVIELVSEVMARGAPSAANKLVGRLPGRRVRSVRLCFLLRTGPLLSLMINENAKGTPFKRSRKGVVEGRLKTAFVLAGGGSFGAIQVGMLQSLVATADVVVGSSVGAINAAYYAGIPTVEGTARLRGPSPSCRTAPIRGDSYKTER